MNTLYTSIIYNDEKMMRELLDKNKRTMDPNTILIAQESCKNTKRFNLLKILQDYLKNIQMLQ